MIGMFRKLKHVTNHQNGRSKLLDEIFTYYEEAMQDTKLPHAKHLQLFCSRST